MGVQQFTENQAIFPSLARTTAPAAVQLKTQGASMLNVIIDITAGANLGAGSSITLTIKGVDNVSGKKYTILASAALVAVATTRLKVGPQIAVSANLIALDYLPDLIEFSIAVGDANSVTYSVAACLTGA